MKSSRTIILGAGQAGVQVAVSLRQGGYTGEVIVVGKEPHVPYQRPPLSKQVLKQEWAAERCQLHHLEFYQQHQIELLLGVSATGLDTAASRVHLDDGSQWTYDHLVVCTGSRLNRLPVSGADLPGVHYLRTIDDALELTACLRPAARLAIIGGGYIGLEVAAAARSLGCAVTVIEALDQVMKRSALPPIAQTLRQRHERAGVRFLLERKVQSIVGHDRVEGVALDEGGSIAVDRVMVGVGVRPDLRWLQGSELETARGIRVDGNCRTNVANIFAAGDVAELRHPLLDGWQVLESVQNAVSQGKIVASSIVGQAQTYTETPWFWSEQYDCRLQMAGIPRAGDRQVMRGHPATGGLSVFSLSGHRLNAVQSINAPRDYMVGRELIGRQTEIDDKLLGDAQTNLKDLL